ncbi:hypothetical protein B484DRAFT_458895 [Ochromonadaceae sp. CCMP2298]|nr:hypothetical protein B484DRAFT_458895 [Ochromonadaceae sp. CCMP2298]|mmetsp:Transcript_24013/g.51969  ORF Transcript_24013/g.51969 Transcript_24013/m.51969 type:complete len:199 (+) Transcript_24013:155-751(+)
MSNPWSKGVTDIALADLIDHINQGQIGTTIAEEEQKLDNYPNDLITKLKLADERIHELSATSEHCLLKAETIMANKLALELTAQLSTIRDHLQAFDRDETFKMLYIQEVRRASQSDIPLSTDFKNRLVETLQESFKVLCKLKVDLNHQPESRCFTDLQRTIVHIGGADDAATEQLFSATHDCTECLAELRKAMLHRRK